MPFYKFIIPAEGPTAKRKPEVARAVTGAHVRVTGAPAEYVHIAFVEVAAGSIFVGARRSKRG